MHAMRPVALPLVLVAAVAACDAEPPATWSYVHTTVVAPACATAGCHSYLAAAAGLDLSTRAGGYAFLTGRICGEPIGPGSPPRNYVDPGSPATSQLMYQLRGTARAQMPPDAPLPEVEIALVGRWIEEGATCE